MGNDIRRNYKRIEPAAQRRHSLGFLSNKVVSINHRLGDSAVFSRPAVRLDGRPPISNILLPPEEDSKTSPTKTNAMAFISVFLPEFPRRRFPGPDLYQVQGFIAKGSFGPILKVKDIFQERIYAVKVLPKSEIMKRGVLEQAKEEVIIQVYSLEQDLGEKLACKGAVVEP